MTYTLRWSTEAQGVFRKLDRSVQRTIDRWLTKNLDGCENPRATGRGLTENLAGFWRYRVGRYRVLAKINDNEIEILILHVGHRSTVYRS